MATVGREPRSSDHFLLQLEGDARVVAAVATQQSWADVVAGRGMHNSVFSGQRCDARFCLGSDGCKARRGMVGVVGRRRG